MQYIHWNRRLYIHGGAVKRQDIFIWFITLFHLIHEQLAPGDGRERGRLVLSSPTPRFYGSVSWRKIGKKEEERRDMETWVSSGDALTMETAKCKVHPPDTTKTYLCGAAQWPRSRQSGERKGIKFKWNRDGLLSGDISYDKLYIMLNPAWCRTIGKTRGKRRRRRSLRALDAACSKINSVGLRWTHWGQGWLSSWDAVQSHGLRTEQTGNQS